MTLLSRNKGVTELAGRLTVAIPHSPDGLDRRLGEARGDELRAQPGEVYCYRTGLDEPVPAPHEVQELVPPVDPAGLGRQGRQELELLRGQGHGPSADGDPESLPAAPEVPDLDP